MEVGPATITSFSGKLTLVIVLVVISSFRWAPESKAEFLAMGVAGVQVGYDYYTAKYSTPGRVL